MGRPGQRLAGGGLCPPHRAGSTGTYGAALQPTGEGDRYFWVHHPYTGEALCPSYTQITLLDAAGHALTTAPITNPEHFTIIS